MMRRAIPCVEGGNNEEDLTAEMHINCSLLVKHVKQRRVVVVGEEGGGSRGLIFITGPLWWFALCQLQYGWLRRLSHFQPSAPNK